MAKRPSRSPKSSHEPNSYKLNGRSTPSTEAAPGDGGDGGRACAGGSAERSEGPPARAVSSGAFPLIDRRLGLDRRNLPVAGDDATGLERRRGPGRRRSDFMKAADEGEMTQEQFLFLMAIGAFKKSNNLMFPTWSDVLEVIRLLGYRKTMPSELNLRNAEDWQEGANTPAKVKTIESHREAA